MKGHSIRWYGVAEGERIPRNRFMRGGDWGWEAVCSCGWTTRTGGAIEARIREAVADHKHAAAYCAHRGEHRTNPYSARPTECVLCGAAV